ncbi:hypothetical protein KAFR_0I00890 [Kazachstania africana CBS 2517]|uniref:Mediator of RNA polymerase II transcription subunit 13 n=1 Tax=Kazachstania africana (strain ATCC 22294 / BCRC 22015 / CBS 2517 / CECT 1963 / NBRC 1671 / NRRL Y-8276) TaxID=1071382 RepID=H2AZS0_KAZAF|nr:hypothetical protein KAFR_0I00890 [Kazachstania africana CBS 2517]CCF59870.1 hypothetical protein KAFR_0I00890 [Kazachstania africana CBS 2517]
MDTDVTVFRMEELSSSFYKIENITKINYRQYIPKHNEDQWSIQMELLLRKQDRKTLVALLSRELWVFSTNDNQLPELPPMTNELVVPEKEGEFTSDYSKPNLPPHYALFLKALRRAIYINLAFESNSQVVQFGNACISLKQSTSDSNYLLQLEPHLFSDGDLAVTVCTKNVGLIPLREENLNEAFFRSHALYLAPSGIRIDYRPTNGQYCLSPAPLNAELLLKTLKHSHGVNFLEQTNLKWITVVPHLAHLNGYTPSISSYIASTTDTKRIVWPLALCFAQPATKITDPLKDDALSFQTFRDALDIVDDFIQLRQSSAYRTPGSITNLGTNPMSSGGGYTEQFQQSYKGPFSGSGHPSINASPSIHSASNHINTDISPNGLGIDKTVLPTDTFSNELFSSPSMSRVSGRKKITVSNNSKISHGNELFNGRSIDDTNTVDISPLKSEIDSFIMMEPPIEPPIENISDDKDLFGEDDEDEDLNNTATGTNPATNLNSYNIDGDEDLFGERNETPASVPKEVTKGGSDEITEDMFGMSEDDEETGRHSSTPAMYYMNPNTDLTKSSVKKRKYLDIPIDEMTLSNSPLYQDPGAPLPIETPRDKRKSVFAPLTFNPIIENNVDNKYKNGGKFSFSPAIKEEALNFDVMQGELSSSEDEESESSFDADQYNNMNQELKSMEDSVHDTNFLNYQPIQGVQDSVPPELLSSNFVSVNDASTRDNTNSIWRIPQSEIVTNESPLKTAEPSLPSLEPNLSTKLLKSEISAFADDVVREKSGSVSPPSDTGLQEATKDSKYQISEKAMSQYSSNSLPFLLRHMPISSIPDVFLEQNVTLKISKTNQDIVNLLCEQVVFDSGILADLSIPRNLYESTTVDEKGVVATAMHNLFSYFEQMHGNQIISKFYSINHPFVFVKKNHDMIKIRADAQIFGKYLNSRPPSGIKNFKLLLLSTSNKNDCLSFISTLSQTYISQEFGFCELLKLTDEDMNGLIHLKDLNKPKLLLLAAQIVSYCSTNKNAGKDATIMILLPLDTVDHWELVSKAKSFQIVRDEVRAKIPDIELFFKVVPLKFIKDSLISIEDIYNFASSIYNILPSKSVKYTSIAHKLPEKIEFRTMQQTNGSTYVHYDAYIHLAYSRSIDKQWVFAALSDSEGKENLIRSWYVGTSKTLFDEACNQLWSLSLSLAGKKYGKICLILTRLNGILPDDELINWRRLSGRNVHLAVVCVDDNTKISFFDQDKFYPTFKPIFKDEKLSQSLKYLRLNDYEIRDIDQDVHGVIFQNPFPLANSQHRCAIKSGALIKFKRTDGNALLDKLEVNLLNCPHSNCKKLLEVILEEFRNLAGLNTWFGVSNGENAHIPWHVLAVKKMMRTMVHTKVEIVD